MLKLLLEVGSSLGNGNVCASTNFLSNTHSTFTLILGWESKYFFPPQKIALKTRSKTNFIKIVTFLNKNLFTVTKLGKNTSSKQV